MQAEGKEHLPEEPPIFVQVSTVTGWSPFRHDVTDVERLGDVDEVDYIYIYY